VHHHICCRTAVPQMAVLLLHVSIAARTSGQQVSTGINRI
jgi:hypothetical protein